MKYTKDIIGRMFNIYPKNIEIRYVNHDDGELMFFDYHSDDYEYGFTQKVKLKRNR